jgi:phenylacetate-CoA ligase
VNDEPVALRCHSVLDGIVWPAIGDGFASQLQSLLFQLEYSQWLPENVLCAQQLAQLKPLLRHAQSTVPHYSQVLQELDANTLTWDAFRALPLLTPKKLQAEFESLKSIAVPPGHGGIAEGKTSGSTGIPLHFLVTDVTQLFWNALTVREHLWQARDFSGKLASVRVKVEEGYWRDWGSPVAKLFRTGPLATLNVRTSIEKQLDWLVQQNPDYLITHASNLLALAELSLRRGIRLPRLRQARSFSEALRSD